MPTYEFRCSNGHVTEQFHRISDSPSVVACATCGAEAPRAISGGAGLVFKGSGFYLTDYGKNAHRGSAPPAKPSEGGKSEGGKSESGGGSSGGGSSGGESGGSSGGASGAPSGGGGAPSSSSSSTSGGGASKASE